MESFWLYLYLLNGDFGGDDVGVGWGVGPSRVELLVEPLKVCELLGEPTKVWGLLAEKPSTP